MLPHLMLPHLWWCNYLLAGCLYTCLNPMLRISFAVGGSTMGISCNKHHHSVLHQVPSGTMDYLLTTFPGPDNNFALTNNIWISPFLQVYKVGSCCSLHRQMTSFSIEMQHNSIPSTRPNIRPQTVYLPIWACQWHFHSPSPLYFGHLVVTLTQCNQSSTPSTHLRP